jgi:hypothetical protein
MPTPIRTLQVAVTAAALLFAQAPAHAQGPAPASPAPAAAPAPAPAPDPVPPTDTRAPSQELPTEAQPLPPWQPPVEQPPGPPATDQPPPADQPPPSDVQAPPTGDGTAETPAPPPAVEPPPAPVDTVKANKLRRAGSGVMITGGAIALAGFAMTLAFTLRGNKFEKDLITVEGNYSSEDCSRGGGSQCDALTAQRQETRDGIANSDRYTKISGGILAAGILVAAIGGIVYRRGMKQLGTANISRLRVSPTFGGLSLSGRF